MRRNEEINTVKQDTAKLTIRLPAKNIEFVKRYARDHGTSVTSVIDRYLSRLREQESNAPSPRLEAITGIIPAHVDGRHEYREHLIQKNKP